MISYHHTSRPSILVLLSQVLKHQFERKMKEMRVFITYMYRLEFLTMRWVKPNIACSVILCVAHQFPSIRTIK